MKLEQLWDICYARRAQYFVLTTYDDWILGNFSECRSLLTHPYYHTLTLVSIGWTSSFVSYPRKWHVKTPTILESLVYWFASSMNKTGGWIPFSIPETVPQIAATGVAEGNDDDLPDSPIGGGRRHMPTLVQNEIVTGPTSLPLPFVSRPPSRASSASSVCAGEQVPAATGAIRCTCFANYVRDLAERLSSQLGRRTREPRRSTGKRSQCRLDQ
jgi:hypothetical protein